ncbi:hypothetical protein F5Y16DRAFT_138430 [Xylariaceae sp. FL0255]|nr:hypothetical protein F5Y16DRAFT_138430 [Xylariaceae sp. FL0255]
MSAAAPAPQEQAAIAPADVAGDTAMALVVGAANANLAPIIAAADVYVAPAPPQAEPPRTPLAGRVAARVAVLSGEGNNSNTSSPRNNTIIKREPERTPRSNHHSQNGSSVTNTPSSHDRRDRSDRDRDRDRGYHGRLATQRLSAECQLRHFNPKFYEKNHAGKVFTCSVDIKGKVISDGKTYTNTFDAKQACARKALGFVTKMSCHQPPSSSHRGHEREDRDERDLHGWRPAPPREPADQIAGSGNRMPIGPGHSAGAQPWGYYTTYNDVGNPSFAQQVQAAFATSGGPSPQILQDPLASQAFLQGLTIGSSLQAPRSYDGYAEPRGRVLLPSSGRPSRPSDERERSPRPDRDYHLRVRDRSPDHRRPN